MPVRRSNKTTANRPPRSTEQKVRRGIVISVGIAAMLGIGNLALDSLDDLDDQKVGSKTRQEQELRRIVSATFDKYTEVVCADLPPNTMGSTIPGTHIIRLDEQQCDLLTDYADRKTDLNDPDQRDATVHAVYAVTHEFGHTKGIVDEGLADCAAIQRMGQALIGFGASQLGAYDTAAKFAEAYKPATPAYAIPEGCSPNGRFDLGIQPGFYPKELKYSPSGIPAG